MKIFKIEIQELLSKVIEIQANNAEEAISKVKEMYENEEIILDYNDYVSFDIEEYDDNLSIQK